MSEPPVVPPVDELIAAYRELGSYKKVAERYGVNPQSKLMAVLRAAGVPPPKRKSPLRLRYRGY